MAKEDYKQCPYCKGDVKTYSLPPVHMDDCEGKYETTEYGKAKEGCTCPQDVLMECDNCSRMLDIGDYHDAEMARKDEEELESQIERFIEHSARPWK